MNNLNIIDQFLQVFIRYIDSGFGLLNGDVAALSTILIALDITIAGLFWALDGEGNVLGALIKKILYVGAFAYIINNFQSLAAIIYNSFAGLGLTATGSGLTAEDLLRPGKIAGTGFQAAYPLLQQAGHYVGFTTLFSHLVPILVLLFAWAIVVLSFFILAVQLFITILEFKLTTLAGFVLVPFALWNKTSFLAERVLGNVVSSGIKVMVLAVIVGIGTTFFSQFTSAVPTQEPSLAAAMSLALGSLALFGLGIFGPGVAAGLVAGAPQLGAGAVAGTAMATAGTAMLAAGGAGMAARGGLGAVRAATAIGSGASTAYGLARATSGTTGLAGVGVGLAGVAKAGAGAAYQAASGVTSNATSGLKASAAAGRQAAWRATGGMRHSSSTSSTSPSSSSSPSASGEPAPHGATGSSGGSSAMPPAWARRLRSQQQRRGHVQNIHQAIKDGDHPGHGLSPTLHEKE
ncbi:MAG: P-type conjugative transfer protein TrbL [Rhodospirillales bacterium 69-11]|nr:MAG: P-type conjugative transfer protein TrbL [Rhodospirillales bacterium 69-11]